jgi:hypothetical protein
LIALSLIVAFLTAISDVCKDHRPRGHRPPTVASPEHAAEGLDVGFLQTPSRDTGWGFHLSSCARQPVVIALPSDHNRRRSAGDGLVHRMIARRVVALGVQVERGLRAG